MDSRTIENTTQQSTSTDRETQTPSSPIGEAHDTLSSIGKINQPSEPVGEIHHRPTPLGEAFQPTTPLGEAHQPSDRSYSTKPQEYLRIPGLTFDQVPLLIPYTHRAALTYLQPRNASLHLSHRQYYDLLTPFYEVASRVVDVFHLCSDAVTHDCPQPRTGESTADFGPLFERVREDLGRNARLAGMKGADVMWIAYMYTQAWESTPTLTKGRDREYWKRGDIHQLHDLLRDWSALLRRRGLQWTDVFGALFGL
ncbi:hypothetical protein C8035_v010281 [Colletotrichum spinosum]|uniref:Uncharacterized protein n=1 Tax=Colletotrichum spinosum TaxID=1347390 RepID=A0A4R8QFI6_9PEZI|nr:hypothetical protein C8035_v010281 [Colletotrichum spinosum]